MLEVWKRRALQEEFVGKYLIDIEWKIFNRQQMLFIDGKYNIEDGMSNRQTNRRKV